MKIQAAFAPVIRLRYLRTDLPTRRASRILLADGSCGNHHRQQLHGRCWGARSKLYYIYIINKPNSLEGNQAMHPLEFPLSFSHFQCNHSLQPPSPDIARALSYETCKPIHSCHPDSRRRFVALHNELPVLFPLLSQQGLHRKNKRFTGSSSFPTRYSTIIISNTFTTTPTTKSYSIQENRPYEAKQQ